MLRYLGCRIQDGVGEVVGTRIAAEAGIGGVLWLGTSLILRSLTAELHVPIAIEKYAQLTS